MQDTIQLEEQLKNNIMNKAILQEQMDNIQTQVTQLDIQITGIRSILQWIAANLPDLESDSD